MRQLSCRGPGVSIAWSVSSSPTLSDDRITKAVFSGEERPMTNALDAKQPKLDADGLLPPSHGPENVPAHDGSLVPAVTMSERARQLMALFNSGAASERYYDLII